MLNKYILRAATVVMMLLFSITAGIYVFIDAEQYYAKSVAEDEVHKKNDLETVKISLSQSGGEVGDEIWVNGKMYDVSSYVIVNDSAIVSVYHDTREQELVQSIVENFESNDTYSNNTSQHIAKYKTHLQDDGKVLTEPFYIQTTIVSSVAHLWDRRVIHLGVISGSVRTPPPDHLLS